MNEWKNFWNARGRITRRPFLLWGIGLLSIKYNLDRFTAAHYGQTWSGIRYFVPSETFALTAIPRSQWPFYATLVAIALPFIAAGVLLTLKRLRDAALPPALVALFFVPVVNLFFFFILSILPSARTSQADEIAHARETLQTPRLGTPRSVARLPDVALPSPRFADRMLFWYPENATASLLASVAIVTLLGGLTAGFSVKYAPNYGWGLFLGAPFCIGFLSALLHGVRAQRTFWQCQWAAFAAIGAACVALLILAVEGAVCIVMALPIIVPMAMLGAGLGYSLQNHPRIPRNDPTVHLLGSTAFLLLPLFLGFEQYLEPTAELLPVRTQVIINAPPERVFPNVVSFSELPPVSVLSKDWIFHTGVAYPLRAHIEGRGVGAVRYCEFSTGPFIEPITVWDAPHLLGFRVVSQPPPLRELSPYGAIETPHLDHFLVSRRGQFLLTRLPGNRTLLEGTTWYQNRMWPQTYWRPWADGVIHRIHERVLSHVKNLSETAAPPRP